MNPPPTTTVDAERLLSHAGWVRELAASLVQDPNLADDLVQETWMAALRHPPATDRPLRGWLATVMRRFLLQRRRSEGRRDAHEALAAPSDGAEDVLERAGQHRAIVDHVMALDEPYRHVLLLRYFEGLTPTEIARRTDTPTATVKTRLARGLERLRERLDESHGDRRTWIAAFAPLVVPRELAPSGVGSAALALTGPGALLMNIKILGATVALALCSVVAYRALTVQDGAPASPPEVAAAVPRTPAEPEALPEDAEPVRTTQRREEVEPEPRAAATRTSGAPPAAATPSPAAVRVAKGRVLDAEGSPLAGLAVAPLRGGASVTSEADGSFEIELEGERGGVALGVADPGWATVLSGLWSSTSSDSEALVVAAPLVQLSGRVVDALGRPMEAATVDFTLPDDFRGRFREILDYSADIEWRRTTGEDGSFSMEVPAVRDASLLARSEGFVPAERAAPTFSDARLRLVLEPRTAGEETIRGIVLDPGGLPVPGASVSLTFNTTETDADGLFELDPGREGSPNVRFGNYVDLVNDTLMAVAPGFLPARYSLAPDESVFPSFVELHLGPTPLEISGRVVDGDGEPLPGTLVWIGDPTLFGAGERGAVHTETMLQDRGPDGGDAGWPFVVADDQGHFTLGGLFDREYRVNAMNRATLERTIERIPAGSPQARITLDGADLYREVRGRVVSRGGEPVPNASVTVVCDAFRSHYRGNLMSTRHGVGQTALTNDDGSFVLTDVPRSLVYVDVRGEDIVPRSIGRDDDTGLAPLWGDDVDDVELEVSLRCHFQLELAPDDAATSIAVLDEDGNQLPIDQFQGNNRRTMDRFPVSAGSTPAFAVSETAATIVLYQGDVELRRSPLRLQPGELTSLTP